MFKNISKSIIVLGIMFTLVLGLSYGTFIYTSDSYRATEMLVSKLSYGIDITASDATVNGKTVNVSSGNTSTALLKVTSLNKIDTKYGVDYKITKGTGTVKYASNTGWLPTGKISENNVGTYEKVIKVVIAATTDMSVDFTVTGGFPNNELTEVASGYTRLTEKAENIISYNDTLVDVVKKETTNNIYGGESTSNYLQYPINEDNTKNIWRILGTYNDIGTKIVSNQVSTTTKSTLSTDLTSFYNTLEKPDNYILATDKFACTNTSCTSSSYSKVGLISTSEYEMLGGINSYLASSESYFGLDNTTIKNITSGGIEETSTTSGLRPAVYLQDYVTVTGSGTVSDPFKLKMPEYAVVLNVVNGSAALPSKMITRGENATYEITPNTGYKLVLSSNTCSNGTLSGNTFTISNVTSAQSCTITLTPESYTLTLDANGGSVSTTSKTVTYDSTYGNLPTPERTGYTFNGWYTANSGGTKIESTTQVKTASNHTLYAHWTPITYTITLNNQSATSAGTTTAYYQYNTTKTVNGTLCYYYTTNALTTCLTNGHTITKPTKTGYTFGGYYTGTNGSGTQYVDANGTFINNIYQTTGNKTLYAKWTANTYTVKYDCNGGTNAPSNQTATYDSTFTVAANTCTKTGYTFNGWYDPTNVSWTSWTGKWKYVNGQYGITNNSLTLKAQWKANTYTLTFNANGGSVSTASKSVTYNSAVGDLPTPTRSGYIFIGWFDSSYKDHPLYFYSDNFPDLKTAFGYNEVSLYNHYLDYGKKEGRQISQFISSSTFTDTSNKTLYAGWVRNYSVTLAVNNGSGGGTKYATYGRNVTFTITPNSNYTFAVSSISCSSGGLSKDSSNSVYTYSRNNITEDITCSITLVSKNTLAGKIITKSSTNADGVYWESGYRYEGSNPNNYIYMTNKNTNTKELWRIIGVFPEGVNNEDIIRVRRHYAQNSYPRLPFNTNDGNYWPQTTMYSSLADSYKLSYYNNTVNYKMFLGASGSYSGHTPRSAYLFERGTTPGYTSKNSYNGITRFIGSVGLMYWSDYGYATIASSSCPRTQDMHDYNTSGCYNQNWLFQGTSYDQITMVPSTIENAGYVVRKSGYGTSTNNVGGSSTPYYHAYSPVMALKIDTTVTGSGTQSDPYVMQ